MAVRRSTAFVSLATSFAVTVAPPLVCSFVLIDSVPLKLKNVAACIVIGKRAGMPSVRL